jgi:N-acetyl-alpha-D-muramate 1-phosphate uridylyltransferase
VSDIGKTAMVLAAGYGQRMRPLTLTRPKPLVEVAGKALIDYGFDRLRQAGVSRAVVNVHYLPEQIEAWAMRQSFPEIVISDERGEILDTGGGVARALPLLGEAPFFVINSDSFWLDREEPALDRLRLAWDDNLMDCLLLVCPLQQTVGYDGTGDFVLSGDGRLQRKSKFNGNPLAYIGAYLVSPRLFAKPPEGKFSMNLLWDQAIATGRLFGISHLGRWLHVGTPEAIDLAAQALKE